MTVKPNWQTWNFWRYRFTEIAVAFVIAIGVIYFTTLAQRSYRNTIPPNAWIVINEVFVPDFIVGEDPMIIYDRSIRQDFPGMWVVEIQKSEADALFSPACLGTGVTEYSTETVIPDRRVSLSWFLGHQNCHLSPGTYRIRATWSIQLPDWPEKKTTYTSAMFTVRAPR